MELTPVSELSSTTEFEEECDMLGINAKTKSAPKSADIKSLDVLQLESENDELRSICGFLDEAYHKSRQKALEWQSFGCYTAQILRREIAMSESKDQATKEQLVKLIKENKELKEMCIYLDQSQNENEADNSLTPPEVMEMTVDTRILSETNKFSGEIPRYTGLTRRSTLKDSLAIRKGVISGINKEIALEEMKKRLDVLEAERLELIKSLSAAHVLAAESTGDDVRQGVNGGNEVPHNLQRQLDSIRKSRHGGGNVYKADVDNSSEYAISSDMIMNAVTLLDVIRRLDAATVSGFPDGRAEGEAVTLRLLINIAWQKIQEKLNKT